MRSQGATQGANSQPKNTKMEYQSLHKLMNIDLKQARYFFLFVFFVWFQKRNLKIIGCWSCPRLGGKTYGGISRDILGCPGISRDIPGYPGISQD